MNSQKSLREILDLIWGRRFLVAGVTLSVFFGAIVISFFLARKYESFTKVRVVDNKQLYDIYGRRLAGAKDATDRIRSIHEELLSRSTISNLIQTLNLDREFLGLPERQLMEAREGLVRRIQADTVVDLMETTPGQLIFRISHTCQDPALAQRIVTHLSTSYQNRQYAEQTRAAAETLASVREKIGEADEEYKKVTNDLASFEERNAEHRFGQASDTPSRLRAAQEKLKGIELEIETLDQQLLDIRAQLAEEPEYIEIQEEQGNEYRVAEIEKELRASRDTLAGLRQRYTDEHPAVQTQIALIARKEKELEAAKQERNVVKRRVPNEVWVELKKSEREVLSELTVKKRFREEYASAAKKLEAQVQAYPELKKQWEALVDRRDYLKGQLLELRQKEESAKVTYSTKAAENAIIFDVLDPPVYPLQPSSPNRTFIALIGLLLGLGGSVGIVFVLDFFDHSFKYTEEVAAAFEIPVLGSIALIETLAEREEVKKKKRIAAAVVVALLVVAGTAAFLQIKYDGLISSFIRETVSLVN